MKNTDYSNKMKDIIIGQLNTKYPDFETNWIEIVKTLGNDFVGMIKDIFQKELKLFDEFSMFKFSIVIDNNFIFGQLKNIIEKNNKLEDSFVYKLVKTSYINVYAPFKLKEELNDKIDTVLKINHDLAHKYADELLESIIIKDAFWIDEWKKANNLIGHIDIDDVPYLALSFHVESHGIISNDKIFHKQNHSRVWNIHDTERIITSYNSGFISFCFISSIGIIFKLIWDVIFAIFKVIGDILTDLIYGIGLIIGGMYKLLKNIPKDIIILLISIGVIALIFSQDFRKNGQNILIKTGDFIKNVFEKIIELIDWISSILIEFREMFKPVGLLSINFVGYLILEFDLMKQEVLKLERERAK